MKILWSALLLGSIQAFSQGEKIALAYQLELFDNKIQVDLLYTPLQNDSTRFTYGMPAFGGQIDIFKGLQGINVESPARVKIDSATRSLTFYYFQNTRVKISYRVADTRKEASTRSQLFRPIILPDYFFIHGVNLFLTPALQNADTNPQVSVQWKKLPGFPVFYAFDPDNDGSHIAITTADSLALRFMTGAKDLTIKKFANESGRNYLVLRATGIPAQTVAELEDFYVLYNTELRQFWKDTRKIKYSLVLQPFLNVNHKMSGVSFGNGFIGKFNKPDSLAKGERKFVIAHEIGHYYLGDLEAFGGENSEGQWFDEGFNDYLTFFNLMSIQSITPDEFENELNKIFKRLYNSPIKDTPNNKIFVNFWKLGDYAKLPYWRGCLFAFYIDNQISIATDNKHSLRDLMLDLKTLVKGRNKKQFTNEEFTHAVSAYLPGDAAAKDFNQYIVNGNTIPFGNRMLLPIFKIETTDQTPFLTIVNRKKCIAHYQFK